MIQASRMILERGAKLLCQTVETGGKTVYPAPYS